MAALVGVILAGGLARRMGGGDKPLRLLGGRPLIAWVIERIRPQVQALILNANGDPARFGGHGLPVVADPFEGHPGPLAGVLAGMHWAETHRPEASHVLTVAGDTPFLPEDLAERLTGALAGQAPDTIAFAASGSGTHQVCGLFPIALADDLEEGLAAGTARKVMDWIGRHPYRAVGFTDGPFGDPFFNANTPDDLAAAEQRLAGAAPPAAG